MDCLIHPTYFPNLAHFKVMVSSEHIHFEVYDHYRKQTFRNRTEIYGANGKLALTVPVNYTQKNRQAFKDIKIFNAEKWQLQHLKSFQYAYSTSPFFEFYIDDLMPVFESDFDYLLDLNLKCMEVLESCLQMELRHILTTAYEKNPMTIMDLRELVHPQWDSFECQPYTQVFSEKHGFISNLSILDLLFNEGPNSELYLNQQTIL